MRDISNDVYKPSKAFYYIKKLEKEITDTWIQNIFTSLSPDNIAQINKGFFDLKIKEICEALRIEKYNIVFTQTGSIAIDTIIRLFTNKNTFSITSKSEHTATYTALQKYSGPNFSIDYNIIDKNEDGSWKIKNSDWFKQLLTELSQAENIDNIFISFLGTSGVSGEITPSDFINEVITLVKKYAAELGITKVYTMIDSCHEIFMLNRDYSKFDFCIFTSHLNFGFNGFAFFLYNETPEIINVLRRENYISDSYIDKGHNPYTLPIMNIATSMIEDAHSLYSDKIYTVRSYVMSRLEEIEKKYGVKFTVLAFNKKRHFPGGPHIISIYLEDNIIDLAKFDHAGVSIVNIFPKEIDNPFTVKYLRFLATHAVIMNDIPEYMDALELFLEREIENLKKPRV